jgi:succinate dehydrogenase/fumarate reductase-like Fe-S protein
VRILATDLEIAERQAICGSCDKRAGLVCSVCKCVLALKVRQNVRLCPLDKWAGVQDASPSVIA